MFNEMKLPKNFLIYQTKLFSNRTDERTQTNLLYSLVKRLYTDFPGDVGCFSPYFMNYMVLRPGQAIFLKPNLPHAYLSGGTYVINLLTRYYLSYKKAKGNLYHLLFSLRIIEIGKKNKHFCEYIMYL